MSTFPNPMPMRQFLAKTLTALALSSAAALPAAHADDSPLWSLAIGVPGLIANVGNAYPVVPQPVYVAPPVQYVPAPGYYVAPPYYAPVPQYRDERRRRGHWDRHHEDDDRGGD
ncbi:MAG: hypothetical protein ACP5GC_01770 [Thiomonas sp.]